MDLISLEHEKTPMSKLPMESRPLRLAPEVARIVERLLAPLTGKKLEAAQAAILVVYQSGKQMSLDQWIEAYEQAITSSGQREAATT